MSCAGCGTPNAPGRRFCMECGAALAVACTACGEANEAGAKFCGGCGARLGDGAPTAATGQGPVGNGWSAGRTGDGAWGHPAPGAASGTASGSAPGPASGSGERRLVSVLFADLVGFTTLAADRDPEAVRELLGRYFERSREIIGRYGGLVEKFIGDAVMAVWGAPTAREDDAERAVRAALDLVDAIPALGREAGLELAVRAGVLTGSAAVTIGATDQGIVAGDLVNTASRLQSVAPPGGVLVGDATRAATEGSIVYEAAGETLLKGKTAPVTAWLARRVATERGEALVPPFTGRADELRLLKEQLHATGREARPRLVSVVGQGGIGKSRLAHELERYLDGVVEGVWWHRGRSPSYGDGLTFWALGEMIRERAGLPGGSDPETTRAALDAMLLRHVPSADERAWIGPGLQVLLGIGAPPAGGREALFAAWRTFFERLSEHGTVALVFEDLHWADDGLLDFIEHLLDWARDRPILVLTLARPELLERRPGWGTDRRGALAIRLEPLSRAAMRDLLEGVVPGIPDAVAAPILERADGIPLYAVETVRMLMADGRLVLHDGRLAVGGPLGDLDIPPSLHALVAARLDALPPADRTLIADAAVLGDSFTEPALAAISGEPADALAPRLASLVRREILTVETDPRSPVRGRHAFVQGIVREVAYGTIGKRDRRARHLAAAHYFGSLGDDEIAGVVASHYLAAWRAAPDGPDGAAVADRARETLIAAADRSERLGALVRAAETLRSAMAVTHAPDARAHLLERIGTLEAYASHVDAAGATLDEAIAAWQALGDEGGELRAVAVWVENQLAVGRLSEAADRLAPYRDRVATLQPPFEPALGAAAAAFAEAVARVSFRTGQLEGAIEWSDLALRLAEPLRIEPVIAEVLISKGSAMTMLGSRREGIALLTGALANAHDRGLVRAALRAANNLASFQTVTDPRASVARTREVIETSHRLGLRSYDAYSAGNSTAALLTGEWDWYRATLDELRAATNDPVAVRELDVLHLSADMWCRDVDEQTFIDLLDEGRAQGDVQLEAAYLSSLVELAYARGDDATAAARGEELVGTTIGAGVPDPALAARLALLTGDRARYERIIGALDLPGGASDIEVALVEGTLHAVEGRTAAATERFRWAIETARAYGLRFVIAWSGLAMAEALPAGTPGRDAAVAEARSILDELGAALLLRRLDAATGLPPA